MRRPGATLTAICALALLTLSTPARALVGVTAAYVPTDTLAGSGNSGAGFGGTGVGILTEFKIARLPYETGLLYEHTRINGNNVPSYTVPFGLAGRRGPIKISLGTYVTSFANAPAGGSSLDWGLRFGLGLGIPLVRRSLSLVLQPSFNIGLVNLGGAGSPFYTRTFAFITGLRFIMGGPRAEVPAETDQRAGK